MGKKKKPKQKGSSPPVRPRPEVPPRPGPGPEVPPRPYTYRPDDMAMKKSPDPVVKSTDRVVKNPLAAAQSEDLPAKGPSADQMSGVSSVIKL